MGLDSRSGFVEREQKLVAVASKIRVLGALSHPAETARTFLSDWGRGDPKLPASVEVEPIRGEAMDVLSRCAKEADRQDPRGRFVSDTAESYRKVAELLSVVGRPELHALSRQIYGGPTELLAGTDTTVLDAADQLIEATASLEVATRVEEGDICLTADHVAEALRARIDAFFTDDPIAVTIDPGLSAKAAASANRVRLRGRTCFSPMDVGQLAEHEVFVHSATALNGRKQPALQSLSLGSPRTTATQEGLATFAELITGVMDLARLRRLALRVRGVHIAEEGADFIEVFRFFLEAGQPESESVLSALRIFRGADPRGRYVFTKDVVYLRGLLGVHTFMRKAIDRNQPQLVARLFVGRLTTRDVLDLEELFETGELTAPRYVPPWAQNLRALAAYLAFSGVLNQIDLSQVGICQLLADPG